MSDTRTALTAIGQLPDGEIDIAGAALQLARVDAPDADWQAAGEHLSEIARGAVAQAAEFETPRLSMRAAALRRLLVATHGYTGDAETYDDLANANLIHVIQRRRGLPVALGVIWLHAANAAGWDAHGLDFPGHFLIGLAGTKEQLVLDPFAGGNVLSAQHLRTLIKQVEGESAELRPGMLRPMTHRAVLLRLQNNIRSRHLQAGRLKDALACTDTMLAIAPDDERLQRDSTELRSRLN